MPEGYLSRKIRNISITLLMKHIIFSIILRIIFFSDSFNESNLNNFLKEKNDVYLQFNISYNFTQKLLEKVAKKLKIKLIYLEN